MTKRGLNLGCGRMIFPSKRDNPFVSHVLYALDVGCPEALDDTVEWVNVDRAALEGVDATCNLFRYNWLPDNLNGPPIFENDSYDVIWCSHIIEHIPHAIQLHPLASTVYSGAINQVMQRLYNEDRDGWSAFFYECWRVLKPGGRLHIVAPYAFSIAGMSDPTHTRYITPGSFSYFAKNPDAPFDYEMPFEFKTATMPDGVTLLNNMKMVGEATELMNIAALMDQAGQRGSDSFERIARQLRDFTHHHVGYIDELYYAFDAEK